MPFSTQLRSLSGAPVLLPACLLASLVMFGSGPAEGRDSEPGAQAGDYRTIEWTDLMPEEDLDALLNPPDYLEDIADGSDADQIDDQLRGDTGGAGESRYELALVSTRIVPELDGEAVRVPGFVVPLAFDEEQRVTSFFLVPFFGACIHMPPPPPNQIIHADYPEGFKLVSLYQPYWISGVLGTSLTENDTATSAYAITVDQLEPYTD